MVRRGPPAATAEDIAAARRHTPGTALSPDPHNDGADAGTWGVDIVRGDGAEYGVDDSGTGKVLGAHRDPDDSDSDIDSEDRAEGSQK